MDTEPLGLEDPEGGEYDRGTGHLFIVSRSERVIVEVTLNGALIHLYDISGSGIHKPSGMTVARHERNPSVLHVYVSDRGVDNAVDPDENDGKIFHFRLDAPG